MGATYTATAWFKLSLQAQMLPEAGDDSHLLRHWAATGGIRSPWCICAQHAWNSAAMSATSALESSLSSSAMLSAWEVPVLTPASTCQHSMGSLQTPSTEVGCLLNSFPHACDKTNIQGFDFATSRPLLVGTRSCVRSCHMLQMLMLPTDGGLGHVLIEGQQIMSDSTEMYKSKVEVLIVDPGRSGPMSCCVTPTV